MGIYTHKKKLSLSGNEYIKNGIVDEQLRKWDVSLQDISNLQGEVVKIGEVTYEDLNLLGDDTSFEITFEDTKESGLIFLRGYAKILTEFNSYSYGYSENRINNVVISSVANSVGSNTTYPDSNVQDILVTLTLNSINLQDWSSGVLEIFIETKVFPNV